MSKYRETRREVERIAQNPIVLLMQTGSRDSVKTFNDQAGRGVALKAF